MKTGLTLLVILFIGVFTRTSYAQVRGEGVGALAGKRMGETIVTVSDGKTAPWAEVIVETGEGDLRAVAEIDSRGIFNFSFNTNYGDVNNLYIYAADEAGITNKVYISGTSISNILLPPTIIGIDDDALPDNSLSLFGFTYPGAQIVLSLVSDQGYSESFDETSDSSTGRWALIVPGLKAGKYVAEAKAYLLSLESIKSQELYFEIGGIILPPAIAEVYEKITDTIKELPNPVKETANIISKIGAPVASSWYLLQLLLTGLGFKDIFTYIVIFYFWLMGLLVGRRKKGKWGVLYDAITKNPVPRGIVRLYKESGELAETDVTGNTGIFSFLPPKGRYKLNIRKPGYDFPSNFVLGKRDGEYSAVYHGEIFEITQEKPVVDISIPIDPKVYQKIKGLKQKLRTFLTRFSGKLNSIIFIPGLVFSFVAYVSNPVLLNIVVMLFYILGILAIAIQGLSKSRMWGVVVDEQNSLQQQVSLSLLDTMLNRQLQRRVTDMSGRYQFVVPAGSYVIKVTSSGLELSSGKGYYSGENLVAVGDKTIIKPKIRVKKTKNYKPLLK
ncbi:carboxypeptidase-like regulatory domain-containing protein [Patescibacteria group bacterium]|nr:carboxypeptidase-like regulatory domain-containing protein [Patescibacteria group bacterium]MBU0845938.1 carboxypeptidase-like regulatory domain-containing protein [Patescibacteria group bacterium]MBU0922966.1 carboxypeptidase-like regulatory domain-containing protein [Patescibacteria group bacterium]MBU1066184.1 carboxypeptidase-like regulatory domain-containing protein [Patescibacteria group bacterium]MBU1844587.1 carboxypeptidase-like regulatory domain-containing protein [Patescibacteria 